MSLYCNFIGLIGKRKKKYVFIICTIIKGLFILLPFTLVAQQEGDRKVIIIPKTTDSLYWQIKYALGKCDYIVREDGNRDTLRTFAAKSPFIEGFTVVSAIIKQGQVELNGFY